MRTQTRTTKKQAATPIRHPAGPFSVQPLGRLAVRKALTGNRAQPKLAAAAPDKALGREADPVPVQVTRAPGPRLQRLTKRANRRVEIFVIAPSRKFALS